MQNGDQIRTYVRQMTDDDFQAAEHGRILEMKKNPLQAAGFFRQSEADYAPSRLAFLRSCSFRKRLRRRIDFGVISTSSSSSMNSTAYSSDI